MKPFIVVCITASLVVVAPAAHTEASRGHGGGHGGHFSGHGGGHGFHGEHFGGHFGRHAFPGGHFGGHAFRKGHFGHFHHFPHGGIFRHPRGFPYGFRQRGVFPHHGGGGGLFAPFAFRAGPPVAIIKDPFFCFPHGLSFPAHETFLMHLQQFHGIAPASSAWQDAASAGGVARHRVAALLRSMEQA